MPKCTCGKELVWDNCNDVYLIGEERIVCKTVKTYSDRTYNEDDSSGAAFLCTCGQFLSFIVTKSGAMHDAEFLKDADWES
jgi:hypothetical protein